jgi:hypothetical protein
VAGSYYLTAQMCSNGHHTTSRLESSPALGAKYCPKCGEAMFHQCPACGSNIRGDYEVPGIIGLSGRYKPPSYCHNCGAPFPWTARRIEAATDLAKESEHLSEEEVKTLGQSIVDLSRDSPRTELAAIRYNKLAKKAGTLIGDGLNKIVISLATEGAKKLLGF